MSPTPKPTLKQRIAAKIEGTIEARQSISATIKSLSSEMAALNGELFAIVEQMDDERYENERWKAQVIRPDKTEFDRNAFEAALLKMGVSAMKIEKARKRATTVTKNGGTPYVRVDAVTADGEKTPRAAKRR